MYIHLPDTGETGQTLSPLKLRGLPAGMEEIMTTHYLTCIILP